MTFIAKKNHSVCMRGKIMAETSKGMPAENRACLTDLLTRYTLGLLWNE